MTVLINPTSGNGANARDVLRGRKPLFDAGEAAEFLNALDPDTETFLFYSGDDDKARAKADKARKQNREPTQGPGSDHRLGALKDARIGRWIADRQAAGANICVTVNAMHGNRRTLANLAAIRAVWCECDDGLPDDFPLEPSYIAESSPGHFHAYWFLDQGSPPMDVDTFEGVMRTMVSQYGSDPGAKDIARALRLPGTVNMKPDRAQHRVAAIHTAGYRYGVDEIVGAFPPQPRFEPDKGPRPKWSGRYGNDLNRFVDPLKAIPADDYATWIEIKLALYHESNGSDAGLALFKSWSATSEKYSGPECEYEWRQSKPRNISGGKIFFLAERNGYVTPQKEQRQTRTAYARPRPAETTKPEPPAPIAPPSWVEVTQTGTPRTRSIANVNAFLESRSVTFSRNKFTGQDYATINGEQRPLSDELMRGLRMEAERIGFSVQREFFDDVCLDAATRNSFNPPLERINGLEWDGTPRLDRWLVDFLGADDSPLNRAFGRKHCIAAVRRLREPGAKHDAILVLEGAQGLGKSSAIRTLAGDDLFSDALTIGADAKQVIELTRGAWLVEMPELSGLRKADVEPVKAMVSRQVDRARLAYDRHSVDRPRQFVLFGTVNERHYLRDATGNRRFWTVAVRKIDLVGLRRWRDQLWAEAAFYEARGECLGLPETLWAAATEAQAARVAPHRWAEILQDHLEGGTGTILKDAVWRLLDLKANIQDGFIGQEVLRIMASLGWEPTRRRHPSNGKPRHGFTNQAAGEPTRWIDPTAIEPGTYSDRDLERRTRD